jgi:hypothetical protein
VAERDAIDGRSGGLFRWVAIPAAVGLLLLVVLGSNTASFAPVAGPIETPFALSAVRIVGYVALVVGVAVLPLAFVFFRRRRFRPLREMGGRIAYRDLTTPPLWARILGAIVLVAVFAAQIAITLTFFLELLRAIRSARDGTSDLGESGDPNPLGPLAPDTASLAVALLIVGAIVAVVLVFAVKWRLEDRAKGMPTRDDQVAVAARAVDVSLAALQAEPDPRRAVIAAYAAMERALATAGLGRVGSEAPIEYLRRVLAASFGAREEITTITQLFQVAKFSHHTVDEPMRVDAIDALQRIRDRKAAAA